MSDSFYLDYAAATPVDSRALDAMQPYLSDRFYNPSAVYMAARKVRSDVELFRARVANVLGAKDQEIIFTAGGTEANNVVIHGVMQKFPDANIVISSIEHESVIEPAGQYEKRIVPVDGKGFIDLTALEEAIDENTVLVSVMYANNEIGTIQPLAQISALIAKLRQVRTNKKPLYFHTDACQAANFLDLSVARLGVDLMTLNGGKIYASKQSGCLYIRTAVEIKPLISGGGQESGLRSGTENVAGISSFATMLQNVQTDRKQETKRQKQMSEALFATLSQKLPDVSLNGSTKNRLPNNLNIQVPGADGERLLMELDEAGIMVSTGSACTASNDEPSHVLKAIGLNDAQASASIRISLGRPVQAEQIPHIASAMIAVIQRHVGYTG